MEYICKCGKKFKKSSSAAVTGYRDTAECTGCPYLLAYGQYEWNGKAYECNVQGHECRATQRIIWSTGLLGDKTGKNTLHILSLDFDFLERVNQWVKEQYPEGEISGSFSRKAIRSAEYESSGRYSYTIYCKPNKAAVAAKRKLLHKFFSSDGFRLDISAEEEKTRILNEIERGKKNCMDYIICKHKDTEKLFALCDGKFCFWDENKRSWYRSNYLAQEYEKAKAKEPLKKEDFMQCDPLEPVDDWEVPGTVLNALEQIKPFPTEQQPDTAAETGIVPDGQQDTSGAETAPVGNWTPGGGAWDDSESIAPAGQSAPVAFDYSGLDKQTVLDLQLAEREFTSGKKMAEIGLRRMAEGVAIAHDVLVANCDKHNNQHCEDSFRRWCESIGLGKDTAYRLLNVAELFSKSSPNQQKILQELSPSLLYAAAKPSAPANLVQGVKDGDITTHKQYQELLKENQQLLAEKENAINAAEAAKAELKDKEKELEGARQMAAAVKQRADKWQAKAEAVSQAPIPAVVADEEEINRRAQKMAEDLTAPLRAELEEAKTRSMDPEQVELDARNAYDSLLLLGRTCQNAWSAVKPQLYKMPEEERSEAINRFNKTLTNIQTEAIECL